MVRASSLTHAHGRRSSVLVVALGVLFILSILSISFARLMKIERDASRSYYHSVRAQQAAEAGVHFALSRLKEQVGLRHWDTYSDPWSFLKETAPGVFFYGHGVPIERSARVSYPLDTDGDGLLEVVAPTTDDLVYGNIVSGLIDKAAATKYGLKAAEAASYGGVGTGLGDNYETKGVSYRLKVLDAASQLNLNLPNSNLATILENLGAAIAAWDSVANPIPVGMGISIVALRTSLGGKFSSKENLTDILSPDAYAAVQDYVTAQSWFDPSTIKPAPLGDPVSLPVLSLQPRAPININTAPWPVLVAVLTGLRGYNREYILDTAEVNRFRVVKILSMPIDLATAMKMATAIETWRKAAPFKEMIELWNLLTAMTTATAPYGISLDKRMAAMAWANLNPNTLLNRFHPEHNRYFTADKADLTVNTTEACLQSMGIFEITSLGRVTIQGGAVLGEAKIRAVYKVMEVMRHTTQKDFVDNKVTQTDTEAYPENIRALGTTAATPYDGYIQLFQQRNPLDGHPQGKINNSPRNPLKPGEPLAYFNWVDSLTGLKKDGSAWLPGGPTTLERTEPQPNISPGDSKSIFGPGTVKAASNVLMEGLSSTPYGKESTFYKPVTGNLPQYRAMGFWVKSPGDFFPLGSATTDWQLWFALVNRGVMGEHLSGEGIEMLWNSHTGKNNTAGNLPLMLRMFCKPSSWSTPAPWSPHMWGLPGPLPDGVHTSARTYDNTKWNPLDWHYFAINSKAALWLDTWVDGVAQGPPLYARSHPMAKFHQGLTHDNNQEDGFFPGNGPHPSAWIGGDHVIDDFWVWDEGAYFTGNATPVPNRFPGGPFSFPVYECRFVPGKTVDVRFGTISWTVYSPVRWKDKNYTPGGIPGPLQSVELDVRLTGDVSPVTITGPGGAHPTPGKMIPKGQDVFYAVRFLTLSKPGSFDNAASPPHPLNVTPILDDVTLTWVLLNPQQLERQAF